MNEKEMLFVVWEFLEKSILSWNSSDRNVSIESSNIMLEDWLLFYQDIDNFREPGELKKNNPLFSYFKKHLNTEYEMVTLTDTTL